MLPSSHPLVLLFFLCLTCRVCVFLFVRSILLLLLRAEKIINKMKRKNSCDLRLPFEPLECRVTFCGNPDSEMAIVLSLDVQGQVGGRREVVLRNWGRHVSFFPHFLSLPIVFVDYYDTHLGVSQRISYTSASCDDVIPSVLFLPPARLVSYV